MKLFNKLAMLKIALVFGIVSTSAMTSVVTAAPETNDTPAKYVLIEGTIDGFDRNGLIVNDRLYTLAKDVEVKRANGEDASVSFLKPKMKVRLEIKYTILDKSFSKEVVRIKVQ